MTHTARLVNSCCGEWEVYVPTSNPVPREWPEHLFARTSPIPTVAERTAALTGLGYEIVPGQRWEWDELEDDDTGPVRLVASVTVRLIGSEESR
ncbi:DUF6303 family protein [Streptomyces sp. NPDC006430]|uniref:DUF6303 family protein n=1 Tax=Streptomyces sp. NPDC006430 TaxID=3154299 RepID=UPI0033B7CD55